MKHISELKIKEKYISIFAGGESVNKLSNEDIKVIQKNTFCIGLNEFNLFDINARVWYDNKITEKLINYSKKLEIYVCNSNAIKQNYIKSDYYFNKKKDNYKRNYSITTIIQLINKYMPDKIIMLFGVDCINNVRYNGVTWEDNPIYKTILPDIKKELEKMYNVGLLDNVFNCSDISAVNIKKLNYKEVLKWKM